MIESTEGKTPLVFLSGIGSMIPEFENNVVKLNAGDAFSFPIKSENAMATEQKKQSLISQLTFSCKMENLLTSCDWQFTSIAR